MKRWWKMVLLETFLPALVSAIGLILILSFVVNVFGWFGGNKPAYSIYDLNLDGKVNSQDSRICYDIFTGHRLATPDMMERADVNKDGLVDDKDCTLIMDAILGKVEK